MKSDIDPISEDEWLLRRVSCQHFQGGRIQPVAFRPVMEGRQPDENGISFFRAACLPDPDELLRGRQNPHRYGIIRLAVTFIRSLGLTIRPDPIPGTPGHVVVPEICCQQYKQDKARLLAIIDKLAEKASSPECIVRRPTP